MNDGWMEVIDFECGSAFIEYIYKMKLDLAFIICCRIVRFSSHKHSPWLVSFC